MRRWTKQQIKEGLITAGLFIALAAVFIYTIAYYN